MSLKEIINRFSYHPPQTDLVKDTHQAVREKAQALALFFEEILVEGREKSLAITKVEEAMFWANASIARPIVEEPF